MQLEKTVEQLESYSKLHNRLREHLIVLPIKSSHNNIITLSDVYGYIELDFNNLTETTVTVV